MRMLLVAVLALSACAAPVDERVGSFNFTLTGSDTNTGSSSSTASSGTGTLAITHGLIDTNYDITIAEVNTNPCSLIGTQDLKDTGTIDIATNQTCTFPFATGSVTATLTMAGAKLTDNTMVLNLAYTYAGTTFGVSFSGAGTRTYQGPRF